MTLTDIQIEIRKIEEQLLLVEEEIENCKPKVDNVKKDEYEQIEKIAKQYPINNMELAEADDIVKVKYVQVLSFLTRNNKINIYEQLLFIARIIYGINLNISMEQIQKDGMEFNTEKIGGFLEILEEQKYSLITDSLIMLNITGTALEEELSLVADISLYMGCSENDMKVMSSVAEAVLKNDFDILNKWESIASNKWSGKFKHYIPHEWIVSNRVLCGECNDYRDNGNRDNGNSVETIIQGSYFHGFRDICKTEVMKQCEVGSLAQKEEVLIEYKEDDVKKVIKASKTGIVYHVDKTKNKEGETELGGVIASDLVNSIASVFGNNSTSARGKIRGVICFYVVSCFDDYEDFEI